MLLSRSPVLFHYIHMHVYPYSAPSLCCHYCLTLKEQLHFLSFQVLKQDLTVSPQVLSAHLKGFFGHLQGSSANSAHEINNNEARHGARMGDTQEDKLGDFYIYTQMTAKERHIFWNWIRLSW